MNTAKTLFTQVMEFVPWTSVARIVDRYSGNAGVRRTSWFSAPSTSKNLEADWDALGVL